jgi:hypothetical protein
MNEQSVTRNHDINLYSFVSHTKYLTIHFHQFNPHPLLTFSIPPPPPLQSIVNLSNDAKSQHFSCVCVSTSHRVVSHTYICHHFLFLPQNRDTIFSTKSHIWQQYNFLSFFVVSSGWKIKIREINVAHTWYYCYGSCCLMLIAHKQLFEVEPHPSLHPQQQQQKY